MDKELLAQILQNYKSLAKIRHEKIDEAEVTQAILYAHDSGVQLNCSNIRALINSGAVRKYATQ